MNRKEYQKPTMQVVKLQHQCHILAGSGGSGSLNDYNWNYPTEE